MNQERMEQEGVGFRCRGCGISVFGEREPKLCTACLANWNDPTSWQYKFLKKQITTCGTVSHMRRDRDVL